jgi:hypothetical protein
MYEDDWMNTEKTITVRINGDKLTQQIKFQTLLFLFNNYSHDSYTQLKYKFYDEENVFRIELSKTIKIR